MSFNVQVREVRFTDGSSVVVPLGGALVVVGANNSGKSLLLRSIANRLVNEPAADDRALLDDIDIIKEGDAEDALNWFRQNISEERRRPNEYYDTWFKNSFGEVPRHLVETFQERPRLHELANFLVATQFADSRLALISESSLYDMLTDIPGDPIQALYANPEKLHRLSGWTQETFGFKVCINRYGTALKILIGEDPAGLPPPPPPIEVLEHYAALQPVGSQGDGIRSFVGLLLQTMLSPRPVVIVDEPEAFLHPPQARRLGKLLLDELPTSSQLIVATHSEDFLQGILDSRDRPVQILRMSNKGSVFTPRAVAPERIRETWSDPLMRYSDLLDGLFHAGVVLCEGDSDCRFYQAVMDEHLSNLPEARDLLFTHVNGKARLGKGIRQLREFHVECAAIVDIDLLNSQQLFKSIIADAGGDWADFEEDFEVVKLAVESMGLTVPTAEATRSKIAELFKGLPGKEGVPDKITEAIKDALAPKSAWHLLKKGGVGILPEAAAESAPRLFAQLQSIGIFVVPVGELERWIPLNANKQNWLTQVLEDNHYHRSPRSLIDFLSSVAGYLNKTL
ncbi:AAA family ATPase [Micromonospora sp. NBC_00821]|uniref:ATP-dependent nuclease n=1 Tax=Micromonospora sp. NBC_00821 TaxID=2975977 RepID=UPI002ED51BB6|nr:AAA family ATPase [Micromonospora sp. NBC_00821]